MFHEVVARCRNKGITKIKEFADDNEMSVRATYYWLQQNGVDWKGVRHNIAYLDLFEGGWWEDGYPLHPDEPLQKYYGLYISAWGVALKRKSTKRMGNIFYKYVEIGHYSDPYVQVWRTKDGQEGTEYLHTIIAKCFMGKTKRQRVGFKSGNTYDCHVNNLYLEEINVKIEQPPKDKVLEEWECSQCKSCITDSSMLHFRDDMIYCSENCADISEEDLKYIKVSVDREEEEWYPSLHKD